MDVAYLFSTDPLCLEKWTQLSHGDFYLKKLPNIVAGFVEAGIGNMKNRSDNFLHIHCDKEAV